MLSAADELDCALITMRLAEENETLDEELRRMVVFPVEVGARRHELETQVTLYRSELQASKSQLHFLRNLASVRKRADLHQSLNLILKYWPLP